VQAVSESKSGFVYSFGPFRLESANQLLFLNDRVISIPPRALSVLQLLVEYGGDLVTKALDCVSGEVGAAVSRALAPGGEMIVYGALSTHRQTDPNMLNIPLFARSVIYETKVVRGFWRPRWFATATPEDVRSALHEVIALVTKEVMTIPEGQPFPVEQVAEAARLAEAPAHGGKPTLTFR